jgi:hypothetical protein
MHGSKDWCDGESEKISTFGVHLNKALVATVHVVFSRAQRFFCLFLLQLYEIVAVHVESSINSSLEWSIPVECGQEGVELIHAIAMRDTIE